MRSAVIVVALVASTHAAVWLLTQEQIDNAPAIGPLASVSYTPNQPSQELDEAYKIPPEQIRADLKTIEPYTRAIRTYATTNGRDQIAPIASEDGLRVTVGTDLEQDPKNSQHQQRLAVNNQRELRAAIDIVRKNHNINGLMVGNETVYQGSTILFARDPADNTPLLGDEDLSNDEKQRLQNAVSPKDRDKILEDINVAHLIKIIHRVKRETGGRVPVTTGEIYSVWRDHPELVSAVDYVAAHILPYWEDTKAEDAVEKAMQQYDELRQKYPGKRIVIAEFGWPSSGYNRHSAEPGYFEQAKVIRDFVARAERHGIEYNIIEAFDQPWKTFEGSVGPYWGLFDASRQQKFPWTRPIIDIGHSKLGIIAVVVSLLVSLPILAMAGASFGEVLLLSIAANIVGAWTATVYGYWDGHYFVPGAAFALGLGVVLLIPLIGIALSRIKEISAILFAGAPRRLLASAQLASADYAPKVSIHIPACREPPEMLKATLNSIARLDYPNFECLIVINNTPDPAFWQPIEDLCRELGPRFKFINIENLVGFKAGALRLALAQTAPDAEVIGVLDADYVVRPDWLKDLVPAFADPQVGLIQAPQDHRDGDRSPLHYAMNGEYAGFFDIGMVQRNEVNAIIIHGTMCLIRRAALEAAGGWSSDTICEDTDLGLTILEHGWIAHYTNRRYGHGLLPDTFAAYKRQRDRWAYGGFQIVRKHWRRFLPGVTRLNSSQKREYLAGWLNWLGAESLGVAVALLNIIWVPVVAFARIAVPDKVLTVPIIAAFVISVAHFTVLYRRRVPIPAGQTAGAMFAAMAMQWTVARAVGLGLIREHLPFVRTDKGGVARKKRLLFPAFYEAVIGSLLVLGAIIVFWTNYDQIREINLFGYVLLVQSVPFLSAASLALFEETPANSFVFWQTLEIRFRELVLRRRAIAGTIAQAASTPADKKLEVVQ
jgi:cellulose synthase/poly-beta-1,6-N-acetylglucosamine synthase-like glycosyltransferase/exo-beta-1,3-glucanase (GH17 family)